MTNLSFYSRKYFSHRDDVTRVSCLTAFRKYSKRLNADWLYNLILKCVQALGSLQPSVIKIRIRTYNDDDFVRGWTVTSWDILRNDFYLLKLGVYEISFILLSCMYTYIVYIHIYIYIYIGFSPALLGSSTQMKNVIQRLFVVHVYSGFFLAHH